MLTYQDTRQATKKPLTCYSLFPMSVLQRGWLRFPLCPWRLAAGGAVCGEGAAMEMLLNGHTSASGATEMWWEQCMVRPAPAPVVHVLCQLPFSPCRELSADVFRGRLVGQNDYVLNFSTGVVGIPPILYIDFYWSV